ARHDLPSGPGVPLPELAVLLARLHVCASARGASRLKIRGGETAVWQRDDRVEPDRLGRDGAAHPGPSPPLPAPAPPQPFDRLPAAMMDDVQRMEGAPAGAQRQTVRPEFVFLSRINRART